MGFWFGLEILRVVYKKRFLKYWTVSTLFELFKKNSTVPYQNWKKISLKLGAKGIKRSGILRWFQKCVELLRQEVPKDFFSEKNFQQAYGIQVLSDPVLCTEVCLARMFEAHELWRWLIGTPFFRGQTVKKPLSVKNTEKNSIPLPRSLLFSIFIKTI